LLSAYEYCPRKLFLENVLKLRVVPGDYVVKGSIRHEIYDRISRAEQGLVKNITREKSYNELVTQYKQLHSNILKQSIIRNKSKLSELKISLTDFFKQTWPGLLMDVKDRAKNVHLFIKKHKVFGDDLWETLSPKIETEHYVNSEELKLKGKIDRLEIYDNKLVKEVVLYELKTGSAPSTGVWPGHKLQVGAYILLLEKNKMFVRDAFVKYLEINKARSVVMNPFLEKKVLEARDAVIKLFRSPELPGIIDNEVKCKSCPLREQCHNEKFIKERMSLIS